MSASTLPSELPSEVPFEVLSEVGSGDLFPAQITVREESTALLDAVVDVVEERLKQRLSETAPKPLGLATGRTMEPLYAALVARLNGWPVAALEHLRVHWCSFNLDEYVGLGAEDPRSFSAYMAQHLGDPLQLSPQQLHLPIGEAADPQQQACRYAAELQSFGGVGLQLLGLGSNGHVGFNEPPCGVDAACRVVPLSQATRQQNANAFGGDPSLVPSQAITLGLREILAADEIHLIVTGSAKADILKALLESPCTDQLPASWLRNHRQVSLWADQAALKSKV